MDSPCHLGPPKKERVGRAQPPIWKKIGQAKPLIIFVPCFYLAPNKNGNIVYSSPAPKKDCSSQFYHQLHYYISIIKLSMALGELIWPNI